MGSQSDEISSGGTYILSLRSGLVDRKQGIVVHIVNEHVGSQSDDMSLGGTCMLSLWSGLANRKRGVVVQTDNEHMGGQSDERIIVIIQAKWSI